MSSKSIGRIWKAFGLKPHHTGGVKVSSAPWFVEKVVDVVGLYLNLPEAAVVVCVWMRSPRFRPWPGPSLRFR